MMKELLIILYQSFNWLISCLKGVSVGFNVIITPIITVLGLHSKAQLLANVGLLAKWRSLLNLFSTGSWVLQIATDILVLLYILMATQVFDIPWDKSAFYFLRGFMGLALPGFLGQTLMIDSMITYIDAII
jgi:hypothetical protein